MRGYDWISNGDPPIYVWHGDSWFNQRDRTLYIADTAKGHWQPKEGAPIAFKKKTRVISSRLDAP